MIRVDVVRLPVDLKPSDLIGHAVVVFDVLRATSTIATALHNGAAEIRAFASLEDARRASSDFTGLKLLAGEKHCLPPEGFDIGNSPGDFTADRVAGKTIFLSTTNGTRAIVAAAKAERMFCAALLNASATADALAKIGLPVTLLCSGTEGAFSVEDFFGAGAVAQRLSQLVATSFTDRTVEAVSAFDTAHRSDRLVTEMRKTNSGHNLRMAKLESDIETAAKVDVLNVVAEVVGVPPIIRAV